MLFIIPLKICRNIIWFIIVVLSFYAIYPNYTTITQDLTHQCVQNTPNILLLMSKCFLTIIHMDIEVDEKISHSFQTKKILSSRFNKLLTLSSFQYELIFKGWEIQVWYGSWYLVSYHVSIYFLWVNN